MAIVFRGTEGETEEKKAGAATPVRLPPLGKSALPPSVAPRARVAASAVSGLGRLSPNFFRRDMAVIASGIGVLLLAPIAEHFIPAPSQDAQLSANPFSGKGGGTFDGSNPFEPGAGGNAPGGLPGGASGPRITPLTGGNPRDMIIRDDDDGDALADASAKAAAAPKKDSGWGDVVKDAASRGARAAIESAGTGQQLKAALTGVLHGMAAASGSTSASGPSSSSLLPALSSRGVPTHGEAVPSSFSLASAAPGYRGVSKRPLAAGGSFDELKAAAMNQGGFLNRGGAANSLRQMAQQAADAQRMLSGGDGGAQSGDQKNPTANPANLSDKKFSGESLAQMKAKLELQNQENLQFEKDEWNQIGRQKMEETAAVQGMFGLASAAVQSVASVIGASMGGNVNGAPVSQQPAMHFNSQ